MWHLDNFRLAPVKVTGDEGDFLVELVERIPYDAPKGSVSTSKVLSHFGHFAVISALPF